MRRHVRSIRRLHATAVVVGLAATVALIAPLRFITAQNPWFVASIFHLVRLTEYSNENSSSLEAALAVVGSASVADAMKIAFQV